MKKLIIAILAASGATIVYAQAETADRQSHGSEFRAEMRALIAGDGMRADQLTKLMQERSQIRFAGLDADGDGVVSLEEFLAATDERSQARFERMGPDENGIVTRAGRKGWSSHHRHGAKAGKGRERAQATPEQRQERLRARVAEEFARLDADGDGAISKEEFEAGMQMRGERFAERRAEHRHERAERRQHRSESSTEGREMRARFHALLREGMNLETYSDFMRERATARYQALDADGNGELTAEEFAAGLADRAQRMFARMDKNQDGLVTPEDGRRGGRK